MSKRAIFPQQGGDRKKPKLDVNAYDHNFPLSQNVSSNKAAQEVFDNWGDDIDDEILLQASQACEQACNSSVLPEYSQFKLPTMTSTQLPQNPVPSSSKGIGTFTFKVLKGCSKNSVSSNPPNCKSSSNVPVYKTCNTPVDTVYLLENYDPDAMLNNQDSSDLYKQLLILKEQNESLKLENGKLLDKCVTKEGEASILRTQLKTVQAAVDNTRLEKMKIQEQAQVQWSGKLNTVNAQLQELQTKLDFKDLEILNLKEKCKMLESNKINLTQVTFGGNDMAILKGNTTAVANNLKTQQTRKSITVCSSAQTDNIPALVKLSKSCRSEKNSLMEIVPIIIDSDTDHQFSMLDYNEELKGPTDFLPNRYTIFSTFHRLLSSDSDWINKSKNKISVSSIFEDLTCIVANNSDIEKTYDRYVNIFTATRSVLEEMQSHLEVISRRLTWAFQKEMGMRYIKSTDTFDVIPEKDLFIGKALYQEEQAMLPRRMVAILYKILEDSKAVHIFMKLQNVGTGNSSDFMNLLCRICSQLDINCCAFLYSGLLLSIVLLLEALTAHSRLDSIGVLAILKNIISSRPMLVVSCRLLRILTTYYKIIDHQNVLCSMNKRELKEDYEHGVLRLSKDTCLLQALLKHVEASLACMGKQRLIQYAVETTRDLLLFYPVFMTTRSQESGKHTCDCDTVLKQVIVYALRTCSSLLVTTEHTTTGAAELASTCRSGLQLLHGWQLCDVRLHHRLDVYVAHLMTFCEHLQAVPHTVYHETMLKELVASFQTVPEDEPSTFQGQSWLQSFESFSLAD